MTHNTRPHDGEGGTSIPLVPIESPPWQLPTAEFGAALKHAFADVELGAYDRRILDWLATWDSPTVLAIASLVLRARQETATQSAAINALLND